MSPVSATGSTAVQLEGMRTLIAHCATFRTWVGAADVAAALEHVFIEGFVPETTLAANRPFALIGLERSAVRQQGQGSAPGFSRGDAYFLTFEQAVDAAHDLKDAAYDFFNKVDPIIEEMLSLTETAVSGADPAATHITIVSLERTEGPMRTNLRGGDQDGDAMAGEWRIEVGFPGGG